MLAPARSLPAPGGLARAAALLGGAAAAAAVLVPVVAARPMVLAGGVALLVAAALAALRPAAAAAVVFGVGAAYGTIAAYAPVLRPDDVVQGALAALWVAVAARLALRGRPTALALWPSLGLLVAFFAVTLVQGVVSGDPEAALRSIVGQELPLSAVLLGALAPWTMATRRRMVRVAVAVAALGSAYACLRYALGPAAKELQAMLSDPANRGYRRSGDVPLFGSFPVPKELGAWSAVTVPFCLAVALLDRSGWRAVAAAAAVLGVVANLGSDTRTALVAVAAASLVVVVAFALTRAASPHRGVVALAVLATAVAVVGGSFVLTQGGDDRYARLLNPASDASYQERQARWSEAWRSVRSEPLGGGLGTAGNVRAMLTDNYTYDVRGQVDSSYVKIALEQGVVLVLFLAALAALLAELLLRGAATRDPARAGPAIGAAGALVAMGVLMYAGVVAETTPAFTAWLLVGLGVGALPAPAPGGGAPRR